MPTPSCQVAPPCTLVLLIVCKKKSLPWLHPPLRSRSLLLQRGNTPSGLVAPSCLLFLLSNKCGSPNKNMMNVVHPSFTENVSKYDTQITFTRINIYFLLSPIKNGTCICLCLTAKVVVRFNSFDSDVLYWWQQISTQMKDILQLNEV